MRPLKLTMTAVGPYADTMELDFTRLKTEGIYLITGDTGAGKSTIFDGILYALYGEPAGSQKDAKMLHSKYAGPNVKPYIRLEFLCRGEQYVVERTPPFQRPGNANPTAPTANLRLPDPEAAPISGTKNVTREITRLLGLNQKQFPQVVMLAQGTFTELLRGDTAKRTEIFRDLFHTKDFQVFQEQVSTDAKNAKADLHAADAAVRDTVSKLICPPGTAENAADPAGDPDSVLYSAWKEACAWMVVPHMEHVRALLDGFEELNRRDADRSSVLAEKEARITEQWNTCNVKKGKAQTDADNRKLLLARQAECEKLKPECDELYRNWQTLRQNPRISALAEEIAALQTQLPAFQKAETASEELHKAEKEQSADLQQKQEDLQACFNSLAAMQAELNSLSDAGLKLHKLQQVKADLDRQNAALTALQKAAQDWQNASGALDRKRQSRQVLREQAERKSAELKEAAQNLEYLQGALKAMNGLDVQETEARSAREQAELETAALRNLQQEFQACAAEKISITDAENAWQDALRLEGDLLDAYNTLHRTFVNEQAGVLAEELRPGMPCPVCGSTEHPAPARITGPVPKQKDLDAAQAKWKKANARTTEKMGIMEQLRTAQQTKWNGLMQQAAAHIEEPDPAQVQTQLETALKAAEEVQTAREQAYQEIQDQLNARERLQKQIDRQEEEKAELEKKQRKLEEDLAKADEEENQLLLNRSAAESALLTLLQRQPALTGCRPEDAAGSIAQEQRALQTEAENNAASLQLAQQEADRYTELNTKQIPDQRNSLALLQGEEQEIRNSLTGTRAHLQSVQEQLTSLKQAVQADTAHQARKRLEDLQKEKGSLQAALDRAEKDYHARQEDLTTLTGGIQSLMEALRDSHEADLPLLEEQCTSLEKQRKEINSALLEVRSRLEANRKTIKNLHEQVKILSELDRKNRWLQDLSDTVSGSISGQEKFSLETWIQTTYFDRVLERANLRFQSMTSGQYRFLRRETGKNHQSQVGLELDVLDYTNGSTRPAASLSGGESFMASLSLALGLSDEIQAEAGGVQLDTMFIDEGFGSLDDNALRQAVRALTGLAGDGRLVGVISHVSALQEMFESQIVVTKEKNGGSKVEIRV